MFLSMHHQSPHHLLLTKLETCCLLLLQLYLSCPSKIGLHLRSSQHNCYHSNMLLDLLTSTCSGAQVDVAAGAVAGVDAGADAVAVATTAVAEERMVTNPADRRCEVLFLSHASGAIHCIHHLCFAGNLCFLLCLFLLL